MPRYVGLDVHKQFIEASFIDEEGKQLHRCRVVVTRESIQTFVAKCLQPSDHVVMEATTNIWEVAELILPHVAKVAIANPLKVKAIAEARVKTDKIDAGVLAQLLRCDFLPQVWIPDKTTRLLPRDVRATRRIGCRPNTHQEPDSKFAGSKTHSCPSTGFVQWMR